MTVSPAAAPARIVAVLHQWKLQMSMPRMAAGCRGAEVQRCRWSGTRAEPQQRGTKSSGAIARAGRGVGYLGWGGDGVTGGGGVEGLGLSVSAIVDCELDGRWRRVRQCISPGRQAAEQQPMHERGVNRHCRGCRHGCRARQLNLFGEQLSRHAGGYGCMPPNPRAATRGAAPRLTHAQLCIGQNTSNY